jgi:hypothetical protein
LILRHLSVFETQPADLVLDLQHLARHGIHRGTGPE